ncbi:MAG: hypothetical protein H7318_10615 [Oligoflexus sp.]|nr:hypothetical protein [Oligoflexus sp.]
MTESANIHDASNIELKLSVQEAAEKIKKFSEDLRTKIHSAQTAAEDKALGLLQSVENISEKLHIKTEAETKAFELLESVDGLSTKLQGYAEGFETKLSESQVQFHLGLMEAMGKWEEIKHQATSVLGAVDLDTVSHNIFDEVKLRANLGKMETLEFIDKSREEWSKAWQQISQQSVLAVKNMNQSIGDIIHRFV